MGAEKISDGRMKRALRRSVLRDAVIWNRHRGLRPEDVFVASYPRSGNTWMRFALSELATDAPSTFRSVEQVAPAVGRQRIGPAVTRGGGRLIKTHEPYRREYRRAIYMLRDVRAVAMSQYRVLSITKFPELTLDTFLEQFARAELDGYGTWQDHVRSWTGDRDPSADVLVIRYEEMRAEPERHLRIAAEFAGIEASEERIAAALEANSKDSMSAREQVDADWGAKQMGWKLSVESPEPTKDWRTTLSDEQLATFEPASAMLAELGYADAKPKAA
jgi:hypothetical protein